MERPVYGSVDQSPAARLPEDPFNAQAPSSRTGVWRRVGGITVTALALSTMLYLATVQPLSTPASSSGTESLAVASPGNVPAGNHVRGPRNAHTVASKDGSSATDSEAATDDDLSTGILGLTATNKYGTQPLSVRNGAYPYNLVLEPHRESTLALTKLDETAAPAPKGQTNYNAVSSSHASSQGIAVTWFVDDVQVGTGVSTTFTCTAVKDLTVRAEVTQTLESEDGSTTTVPIATVTEDTAKCVYVRRELRSLQDDDLETFLDALSQVYRLSKEEGVAKYGDSYQSIDDFMMKHLLGAGQKECDHWHDDSGVLTHHIAYTLEMEKNLQLIDPSIALAYWDYVLDGDNADDDNDNAERNSFKNSEVMSSKMFGPIDPDNDLHTTAEGRWAYIPVSDAPEDFKVQNAYGQLRTPWNLNPSGYLGRSSDLLNASDFNIPGCSEEATLLQSRTLAVFNRVASTEYHGSVHLRLGGAWLLNGEKASVTEFFPFLDYALAAGIVAQQPLYLKRLWRHGWSRCPSSCSLSEDAPDGFSSTTCDCAVPEEYVAKYNASYILSEAGINVVAMTNEQNLPDEYTERILQFFGTSQAVGEMATSGAPLDPLFWVVHPSAERALQYMYTRSDRGEITFDWTWGYDHSVQVATDDSSTYCDWSVVDNEYDSSQMPDCVTLTTESCEGHNEFDELEFPDLLGAGTGNPTNADVLELALPSSTVRPYLYEEFDFSFCTEMGYTF